MSTELERRLRRRIALAGPMAIAEFMAEANANPALGYYRRGRAMGAAGDFITAPEISQMFGELIGGWLAERWLMLGRPDPVRLVELGPGRGTLLCDALRAMRTVPGLLAALHLHLVEIDDGLRAIQRQALDGCKASKQWHERFDEVPGDAPLLLIANEFFDALPIRQLVRTAVGWHERMIGLTSADACGAAGESADMLAFAFAPGPSPLAALLPGDVSGKDVVGSIAEVSPACLHAAQSIALRLVRTRGAALIVDYGYDEGSNGDTLQAVRDHARVSIFKDIGEIDLSAHVNFGALARAAREAGAAVDGPVGQGEFLFGLGIEARAEVLKRRATAAQAQAIDSATARLSDPGQMGTLFRVLGLRDPATPSAPGFRTVERVDNLHSELAP